MNQRDLGILAVRGTDEWLLEAREALVRVLRDYCDYHGHKVVAAALGRRNRAQISQAVKPSPEQRNGHRFYLDDLPWLVANAPNSDFADLVASMQATKYTQEEILVAKAQVFEDSLSLCPDVRRVIDEKTLVQAAKNRAQRGSVISMAAAGLRGVGT